MPVLPSPPALLRRWVFPEAPDPVRVARISGELRLPPPLSALLVQRGFGEPDAARAFLRPRAGQIHDPGTLAGVGAAVERLVRAAHAGETVLVHGDYDVDGICATAILTRALTSMGVRVTPFVPHRVHDGYDLADAGLRTASAAGATLIVTGDCGVVAHGAVERARRAGIDVIVTDHHTPGSELPPAVAVVNPNRADCDYPDKGLAGAAVAYKLCAAVAGALGYPQERLHALLDLVAIATIADLAPLTGENRALVRWGLRVLPLTPNSGLRALLCVAGLDARGEITAGQVGFVLAPRLNAVGRMGDAMLGVRLLLTDDAREAGEIALQLEAENRRRQAADTETLRDVLDTLEREYDADRDRAVVLASPHWHPGVIGIVASRVVERIHRPTVLISLAGAEGKGSARSIRGFHLYEAMRACSGHLLRFGGHRYAAGCSILPGRVEAFRADFGEHARVHLDDDLLLPEVRIDLDVALADAGANLFRMLRHVAPFGQGNPAPVFAARGVRVEGPRTVGQNHLKLRLADGGRTLDAIGFGMADRFPDRAFFGAPIDVAFRLEEHEWNGTVSLQAKLVDLRSAA